MLHLHPSNRTERLADALLERLAAPRPGRSLFDADRVLVPSAGLRRWLSLRIADRFGVCAQVEFGFLAQWLWQQIGDRVPGIAAESPFARERLSWRVFEAFGDASFTSAHPRLHRYLAEADAVMRFELAQRVASTIEQTITYRPDWLDAWQHSRFVMPRIDGRPDADEAWQAALWRRIRAVDGGENDPGRGDSAGPAADRRHPAEAFVQVLDATRGAGLPRELHVFALPAVAPLHASLLLQMARWCDVHVYLLNPCREFWTEIVDRKRLARLEARGERDVHEEGHRLLASWGRQTQALVDTWQQVPDQDAGSPAQIPLHGWPAAEVIEHPRFEAAPGPHLLAHLQNTILELQAIEPGSLAGHGPSDDASIEIQSAHSLTRELEALHERLLAAFAADATLKPGDVLVVTPNLEEAAPLIDAVFGTVPPALALPYAITGLGRSRENHIARLLLDLMSLLRSRALSTETMAWVALPPVARRFRLDAAALTQAHTWLADAGWRWGWDAAHRSSFGLPADSHQSLADAMDRLLLGHALPAAVAVDALARGMSPPGQAERLPVDGAEGLSAATLGSLHRVFEHLQTLQRDWARPATAMDWLRRCTAALDTLIQADASELDDARELRERLASLCTAIEAAAPGAALPLAVLQAALTQTLDDTVHGGVPTGAITFSSMSSLRGVPFRIVCAVGLDDGAFPGRDATPEFDLLSRAPRRGDRQRRDDDRNLFLDLMLAARDRLILSWTGRHVRDNSLLPPSTVIAELLDLLLPAVVPAGADAAALAAARRWLVVEHPLQGLSLAVFTADPDADPRWRSHRADGADALRQSLAGTVHDADADADTDGHVEVDVETAWLADLDSHGDGGVEGNGYGDRDGNGDPTASPPGETTGSTPDRSAESPLSEDTGADGGAADEGSDEVAAAESRSPFFLRRLPALELPETLALDDLIRFWRHPDRSLLRERLRIDLSVEDEVLIDEEAFVPDRDLERDTDQQWLPWLLGRAGDANTQADTLRRLVQAGPNWPHGPVGAASLARQIDTLARFAQQVRSLRGPPTEVRVPVAVAVAIALPPTAGRDRAQGRPPLRLTHTFGLDGELSRMPHGSALVRWRAGPLSGGDVMALWLQHLTACAAAEAGWAEAPGDAITIEAREAREALQALDASWHIATDRTLTFGPVPGAAALLQPWLVGWLEGQRRPLPFWPRAAWARACRLDSADAGGAVRPGRIETARAMFRGSPGGWSDQHDRWQRLAFRDQPEPLGAEFEHWAERLFGPVRDHLQQLVGGSGDV
jgi:exodeoxyribonuclease V gamma subunit